jgi:hypothetical protein
MPEYAVAAKLVPASQYHFVCFAQRFETNRTFGGLHGFFFGF